MAWSVTLDFQEGGGARDITDKVLIKSFQRTQAIWNDLRPTANFCMFQMHRDVTINNLLMSNEKDTLVKIKDADGDDYFTGIVRPNFDGSVKTLIGPLSIECVDYSELLKKKIRSTFAWANYKVCDNTTPASSLVHQLLIKAGFTVGDVNISDILKTVPWFVNVASFEEQTYWDALEKALFEFGYIWYWNKSGQFCAYNFLPSSIPSTFTFDNSTMEGTLKYNRKLNKYEAFEVDWWKLATETGALVFSETSGGSDVSKCSILVKNGDYYPEGSDVANVYCEYNFDGGEIVYVGNVAANFTLNGITQVTFTSYFKRAALCLHNLTGGDRYIEQLDITGDVTYKKILNKSKAEFIVNSELSYKYEALYLSVEEDASKLVSGILRYYRYSPISYVVLSHSDVEPGAIVTVAESNLALSQVCVVVKKEDVDVVTGLYHYTCEGIAAYSAETVVNESVIISPPPPPPGQDVQVDGVTATEVINGFSRGGGTTVPTVPTIAICKAIATKSILLQWDRQLNLTNFDRYEVQVSSDNTNWYSLKFDGTDWKDTLDADTDWTAEVIVHCGIPHGGTAEAPTGTALYYRVRRVTKAALKSAWSSSATATENVIEAGDIAANAIYANNVNTAFLQAVFANISGELIIGATYDPVTGTPGEGDLKVIIDNSELGAYEYIAGAWTLVFKTGGDGNMKWYLQSRGLIRPGTDISGLALGDVAPSAAAKIFSFDNKYTDQAAADPWDTKSGTRSFVAPGRFGSYGLTGNVGALIDNDAQGCDFGNPFGVDAWVKPSALPAATQEKKLMELRSAESTTNGDYGTVATLESGFEIKHLCAVKLSPTQAIIIGELVDGNNTIRAQLVTVSGDTTTYGDYTTVVTAEQFGRISGCKISDNEILVTWTGGIDLWLAAIALDGADLEPHTSHLVIAGAKVGEVRLLAANKIIVAYRKTADNKIYVKAATFSIDSYFEVTFTWGDEVLVDTSIDNYNFGLDQLTTDTAVLAYTDAASDGASIIITAAGTVLDAHLADKKVFSVTAGADYICGISITALDTTHFIVAYYNSNTATFVCLIAASVAGTVATYGASVDMQSPGTGLSITKLSATQALVVRCFNATDIRGQFATISGTAITLIPAGAAAIISADVPTVDSELKSRSLCCLALDDFRSIVVWSRNAAVVACKTRMVYARGTAAYISLILTGIRFSYFNSQNSIGRLDSDFAAVAGNWYHVSMNFLFASTNLYFTVNKSSATRSVAGHTLVTTALSITISLPETAYAVEWSDLLVLPDVYLAYDTDSEAHVDAGQLWVDATTGIDSLLSQFIMTKAGGYIHLLSPTKYYAPVAGEPSLGTPHPHFATILSTDPADTNVHSIDLIALGFPTGLKRVRGRALVAGATAGKAFYVINAEYSETYGGARTQVAAVTSEGWFDSPVTATGLIYWVVSNADITSAILVSVTYDI